MTDLNTHYEMVASSEKPLLLEFGAEWCPPCKAMAPLLEIFAKEHADEIDVVQYDVDEQTEIAGVYGVASIPTFIVIKDGEIVAYRAGAMGKGALEELIAPAL